MLGAWVGWRSASPLPTLAQAREITEVVVPDSTIAEVTRHDALFYYENRDDHSFNRARALLIGDDDYTAGSVEVRLTDHLRDVRPVADRLERDGWETNNAAAFGLTARKGNWTLQVVLETSSDFRSAISFGRTEPGSVFPLALTGWAVGLALGYLLTTRVSALIRKMHIALRTAVYSLAGAGLLLLLPNTLVVPFIGAYSMVSLPPTMTPDAVWSFYMIWGIKGITNLGALMLSMATGTALVGAALSRAKS
ncbi:hypothetical protein WEI85_17705 [Actinomycetes bacterium KLBMP 9797]